MSTAGAGELKLIGGRACLDFTNTVASHGPPPSGDRLASYPDLVAWALHAGLVDRAGAARLARAERADPLRAGRVLRRALRLREALYGLFRAAIEARNPRPLDLATLNHDLSQALAHLELVRTAEGLALDWPRDEVPLERVLWPVVRSAADLLASPGDLSRLRHCAGDDCDWLFLDQSRNRSRRWCDMRDCGNRAKVRRFYAGRRAHRAAAGEDRASAG